jgi:hypothetical protein
VTIRNLRNIFCTALAKTERRLLLLMKYQTLKKKEIAEVLVLGSLEMKSKLVQNLLLTLKLQMKCRQGRLVASASVIISAKRMVIVARITSSNAETVTMVEVEVLWDPFKAV